MFPIRKYVHRFTQMRFNLRCFSADSQLVNVNINSDSGVATVNFNRPPVNSLNLELLQKFGSVLDTLEVEKCRGMILTSDSGSVFSAGLDITEMYNPQPERLRKFWTTLQDTWLKLYSSTFPTAAAINGHSPAGGCLLALSCEYRVMVGPKNTIGLNETRLGIRAPKWFMDCMNSVIGPRQTELALTTGRMFTAQEALDAGLVDELATDRADAISKAEAFLASFKGIPPKARTMTKLAFRRETIEWLKLNREKDLNSFVDFITQPTTQKGLGAYIQSLKKK